VLKRP